MSEQNIKNVIKRLERLEKAVFSTEKKPALNVSKPNKYEGPKGGILMLISNGFFDISRNTLDVKDELAKNGYHYHRNAIQTALNRLSTAKGPLTSFVENALKVSAKRK